MNVQWTSTQQRVLDDARAWLDDPNGAPLKKLFGVAGSGKTTLAKHLVEGRNARFCAYTGKAALVLRDHGSPDATTIHRLMYRPVEEMSGEGSNRVRAVSFEVCPDCELYQKNVDVVVADECSMIDERTARDLLSFGIKILVLGDPFQLPPINGKSPFGTEPDWLLTEVHRQARESGVLRLATDVREGRGVDDRPGSYGDDVVIIDAPSFASFDAKEIVTAVGQILVGTNESRVAANQWARDALNFEGQPNEFLPVPGDKLVCLRNNHRLGLMNGSQWSVRHARYDRGSRWDAAHVQLDIKSLDEDDLEMSVTAWPQPFAGQGEELRRLTWQTLKQHQEFDYAYAMTVHKSQGSAWPMVAVLDESYVFGYEAPRHLYTAITRASRNVIVVR